MRRLLTVLLTCLGACGDNRILPPDAAPAFETAPHVPMPEVKPHAGVVLASVELVTITYAGHEAADALEVFGDVIVGSRWYADAGAEYQVGPGTHLQKYRITDASVPNEVTRADIRARVTQLIVDGELAAPDPTKHDRLYLLYLPPSIALHDPDVPAGPGGNRSYHEQVTLKTGERFPIAVVIDEGKGFDRTTLTAGRQLIQAATNPYETPDDGYYVNAPEEDPWSLVAGGVADLCEGEDPVYESSYALPRVYSKEAAEAGNSPCKPFVPDDAWSDVTPRPSRLQKARPGETVTFELTGWSTREMPDWKLSTHVADRSEMSELEMKPRLSDDKINNKRSVTLTLEVPETAQRGTVGGIYILSGANVRQWAVGFIVQ